MRAQRRAISIACSSSASMIQYTAGKAAGRQTGAPTWGSGPT